MARTLAIILAVAALGAGVPALAIDLDRGNRGLVVRQPVARIAPPRIDGAEARRPAVRAGLADYYPARWYNAPLQFSRTGRDERAYPRSYCATGEARCRPD